MSFVSEFKGDFMKSLDELKRSIIERQKLVDEKAKFAVKIRDYTAEAIYALTNEILEIEKLIIINIAMQAGK